MIVITCVGAPNETPIVQAQNEKNTKGLGFVHAMMERGGPSYLIIAGYW